MAIKAEKSFEGSGIEFGGGPTKGRTESKASLEVRELVREIGKILSIFPLGPGFFGEEPKYPGQKKGFFKKTDKFDVSKLRKEVNNFTGSQTVSNIRSQVKEALKQHPNNADLHGLNAILVFNDAMQAGATDLSKVDVLRGATVEMGLALNNGGLSLFNANWFMAMYTSFLAVHGDRVKRLNHQSQGERDPEVHRLRKELNHDLNMVRHLNIVKDRQKGLKRINKLFQGSGLFIYPLDKVLVGKAAQAYLNGGKDAVMENNLKCGHVMQLLFVLATLFSNIPCFNLLVKEVLDMVPEIHRDFLLQKRMIIANQGTLDFYLTFVRSDSEAARVIANRLFTFHQETIEQFLKETLLQNPWEADPFLRAGWLVKDSQDLYKTDQLMLRVEKVTPWLRIVMGERCQVKGAGQAASALTYDMQKIRANHGF